jgi:hypothetical protein
LLFGKLKVLSVFASRAGRAEQAEPSRPRKLKVLSVFKTTGEQYVDAIAHCAKRGWRQPTLAV